MRSAALLLFVAGCNSSTTTATVIKPTGPAPNAFCKQCRNFFYLEPTKDKEANYTTCTVCGSYFAPRAMFHADATPEGQQLIKKRDEQRRQGNEAMSKRAFDEEMSNIRKQLKGK